MADASFSERFSALPDPALDEAKRRLGQGMAPVQPATPASRPALAPVENPQAPQLSTGTGLPPPPHLRDAPAPQPADERNPLEVFDVFKNPAIIMAGLGSLFTRNSLTTAFNAGAGAINGFRSGQKQVFEENKERWRQAAEQALEQNQTEITKYKIALEQRDMKARMASMYAIASQTDNPIIKTMMQKGDVGGAYDLIQKMAEVQVKAKEAYEITKARKTAEAEVGPAGLDQKTKHQLALQLIAGNTQALTGLFRSPGAKVAIEEEARRTLVDDQGLSEQEAADKITQAGLRMKQFSAGAAVTGRMAGSVEVAIGQARQSAQRVLEALEAVDRTKFPNLNKLVRAAETGSGSEAEIRLGEAINTFQNNYSRAIATGGGRVTDSTRHEAMELLQGYWSKGQIRAGIDQLLNKELPSELRGAREGGEEYIRSFGTSGKTSESPATAAPSGRGALVPGKSTYTDPDSGMTYFFKGGDPGKEASWEPMS